MFDRNNISLGFLVKAQVIDGDVRTNLRIYVMVKIIDLIYLVKTDEVLEDEKV